jgi:SEC-C motif-containing protein
MSACPCSPDRPYADCCCPLHADLRPAASAEALMRSRYSAFVLGRSDYLLDTWHRATRPDALELDPAVRWLGLDVRRHAQDGDTAIVEFVARCRVGGGAAQRLHEVSRFVREDGRWFYVEGEFPERRSLRQ